MYIQIEKYIYINVNEEEAKQIDELLNIILAKHGSYDVDLEDLELLKNEGLMDEDFYKDLEEEVDVTSFAIIYEQWYGNMTNIILKEKTMIQELERYRIADKEFNTATDELRDKLTTHPVKSIVIFAPDNIKFYTKNYSADVYLDRDRKDVYIQKVCNIEDLPKSDEEIAEYIKELNIEKKEFEDYIDNLFKAI